MIEKAPLAPITDVVRETVDDKGNMVRTKIKGINMAGLARLLSAVNETARIASRGHRSWDRGSERENDEQPEIKGLVWMEATIDEDGNPI